MECRQLHDNVDDIDTKKKFIPSIMISVHGNELTHILSYSKQHFGLDIKVIGIIGRWIPGYIGLVLNVGTLKEAFIAGIDVEVW